MPISGENAALDFEPLTPDEAEGLPWETGDVKTTA